MSEPLLVEFYSGRATDFAGRLIDDIWAMSLDELEYNHDYIQWLFPLRERSAVQPRVPVLDDATIRAFGSVELRDRLERSARVMARFYGLDVGDRVVRRAPDFEDRRRVWLTPGNHNFLRLTRILKSLTTFGHAALASAWLDALLSIYDENAKIIGPTTLQFWRNAIAPQSG